MAQDADTKVVLPHSRNVYLRPSTIHRHLPVLWLRYSRRSAMILRPERYLDQVQMNRCIRSALQDLFEYLDEIDHGVGKSAHLRESLEDAWNSRGPRRGRRGETFFALGLIFLPDNFGCSKEIYSIMENFVIRHSTEILKDFSSASRYISILQAIDPGKRFDLRRILSYLAEKAGSLQDIDDIRWAGKLDCGAQTKLEAILRQIGSRTPQLNVGVVCVNCAAPIWPQYAWDSNRQRGAFPPLWADCVTDNIGPLQQCDACFRVWGPVSTLDRWGLPRGREACFLRHAAHEDNYETECTPRGFGDVRANTPRFMQPVVHDDEHWYPPLSHWADVMT